MVKVSMMCGQRDFGKDWVHVDRQVLPHITTDDIYLTGMGDVDLIYCSHGIAYFDREEIKPLLRAWKRALKKGGILRLATPDWDALKTITPPLLGPLYGKMSEPPIYHKTVYDYDSLANLLRECGFNFVKPYDNTKTDHAQFDDHSFAVYNGIQISLNLECNA